MPLLTRPGPHRVSEHRLEGQTQLVSELHFLTYDQVVGTWHGISDLQSSSRPADANAVPVTAVLLPAKLMLIPAGSQLMANFKKRQIFVLFLFLTHCRRVVGPQGGVKDWQAEVFCVSECQTGFPAC